MAQALSEGTQDARLLFHASMIAHKAGDPNEALRFLTKASELKHLLLPSEREQLQSITDPTAKTVVAATGTDNNKP